MNDLTLGPVFDMLDVLVRVLKILQDVLRVRVEERRLRSAALLDRHAPRSVLDAGGDVSGESISVRGGEIHVFGASRAVERVEWVHSLDFTGVGVHAARRLARLDVTPDHGCYIEIVGQ